MSKGLYWASVLVGILFLFQYWLSFFTKFQSGNVWGHKNYWGADVGIFLLLAVLIVATPIFFYLSWKHYPRKLRKTNGDEHD